MCIRDSGKEERTLLMRESNRLIQVAVIRNGRITEGEVTYICLLYTSDAADERSSVDLGGRRIIKKKNNQNNDGIEAVGIKKNN